MHQLLYAWNSMSLLYLPSIFHIAWLMVLGVLWKNSETIVFVYFTDLKQTHDIGFHNFFQYNRMSCKQVFVVRQIPLLLSFALTIHKSQGMTLKSVMVNCEGAFDPGQLGVALSRVRDINDMGMLNFRAGLCPPHPPCVNAYYGSIQEGLHHDLSCCNLTYGDFFADIIDDSSDGDFHADDGSVHDGCKDAHDDDDDDDDDENDDDDDDHDDDHDDEHDDYEERDGDDKGMEKGHSVLSQGIIMMMGRLLASWTAKM